MYTNDRNAYRKAFFTVWQKHKEKHMLDPLETQLLSVMLQHPEYHRLLENPTTIENQEFAIEENPFFHMSMHLAITEQYQTNRPQGFTEIYNTLASSHENIHALQHQLMECLTKMLWDAQQTGSMPSDEEYLRLLGTIK